MKDKKRYITGGVIYTDPKPDYTTYLKKSPVDLQELVADMNMLRDVLKGTQWTTRRTYRADHFIVTEDRVDEWQIARDRIYYLGDRIVAVMQNCFTGEHAILAVSAGEQTKWKHFIKNITFFDYMDRCGYGRETTLTETFKALDHEPIKQAEENNNADSEQKI